MKVPSPPPMRQEWRPMLPWHFGVFAVGYAAVIAAGVWWLVPHGGWWQ